MNEFSSYMEASWTHLIAVWRAYSSLQAIHLPQGSWKVAYSLLYLVEDQHRVFPSDWKPTVLGLVHRTVWVLFFYSRIPPRNLRGFNLLTLWTPVFFLKTFLEDFRDIGFLFITHLFLGQEFVCFLSIPVSGHNYNKRVHYAHCVKT